MSTPKRGLGKGLDALLSQSTSAQARNIKESNQDVSNENSLVIADGELKELPIDQLQPGQYQPRQDMSEEALHELTLSIQSQGIIQPIVVRQLLSGKYEIIAGERRWRASKQAGFNKVPCIIREIEDRAAIAMSLIENIQREDLNVIEEAVALERLQSEFSLTHQQVSDAVGKSRTTVSNLLRLNNLVDSVKQLVSEKRLDMGHARALLSLEGEQQAEVAQTIAKKQLTVRETEKLVKKVLQPKDEVEKKKPEPVSEEIQQQLVGLKQKLSTDVKLVQGQKDSGKIVINYGNASELQILLSKLS